MLTDLHVGLDDRDLGHSHALSLDDASLECRIIDLLVKRWVVTALCIDIMSQHVMSVVYATSRRVYVSLAICVEGRLSKVGGEG